MLAAKKARALRSQFATLNIVSMAFIIPSTTWKTEVQGQAMAGKGQVPSLLAERAR